MRLRLSAWLCVLFISVSMADDSVEQTSEGIRWKLSYAVTSTGRRSSMTFSTKEAAEALQNTVKDVIDQGSNKNEYTEFKLERLDEQANSKNRGEPKDSEANHASLPRNANTIVEVKKVDALPSVHLEGRTGKGTIGNSKVSFQFGPNNQMTIKGEMLGAGVWTRSGSQVSLETELSIFEGTIDGDVISRIRRTKGNSQSSIEWNVKLEEVDQKSAIVGTWLLDKFPARTQVFRADGTGAENGSTSVRWNWKYERGQFFVREASQNSRNSQSSNRWFVATIAGDRLSFLGYEYSRKR